MADSICLTNDSRPPFARANPGLSSPCRDLLTSVDHSRWPSRSFCANTQRVLRQSTISLSNEPRIHKSFRILPLNSRIPLSFIFEKWNLNVQDGVVRISGHWQPVVNHNAGTAKDPARKDFG